MWICIGIFIVLVLMFPEAMGAIVRVLAQLIGVIVVGGILWFMSVGA
jgi:hypothetical protein